MLIIVIVVLFPIVLVCRYSGILHPAVWELPDLLCL